jgi:hypothetical protein
VAVSSGVRRAHLTSRPMDAGARDVHGLPGVLPGEESCLLREGQLPEPLVLARWATQFMGRSQESHEEKEARRSAHIAHSEASVGGLRYLTAAEAVAESRGAPR